MCHVQNKKHHFLPFALQIHIKTSFQMKEGWLKILKPVTSEIAIFREKIRILSGIPP